MFDNNLRLFLVLTVVVACVMMIGYIEDPCITEGLSAGCMN